MSIPTQDDEESFEDRPIRYSGEWRPSADLTERRVFHGSQPRRERSLPLGLLIAAAVGGFAIALFGPCQRADTEREREQELARLQGELESAKERAAQLESELTLEKPVAKPAEQPIDTPVARTEEPEPAPEPAPQAEARRELTPEEVLRLGEPAAETPTVAPAPAAVETPSEEPPRVEPDQVALAESQRATSLFASPDPGAPGTRSGSGACQVLAPAEAGWTTSAQPTLYWHASPGIRFPGVFTLTREGSDEPILRGRLEAPDGPGIQRIELSQTAVSLEEGVSYRWKVAFADPAVPEADGDVASGGIRRVAPPEMLRAIDGPATVSERLDALERAGLWYDAFDLVTRSIEDNSGAKHLVARRSAMLARVGIHLPGGA